MIEPIPLIGLKGNERLLRLFEKKIGARSGCWQWIGASSLNNDGKPRAQFRAHVEHDCRSRRTTSASRVAYALFKGDVGPGELVLHSCDNAMCVNPDHLRLGSHADNTGDMLCRGRGMVGRKRDPATVKRGYKRPFMNRVRKLTDDQVRGIRAAEAEGWRELELLAWGYGVSREHVWGIRQRKRKAHVPDEGPVAGPWRRGLRERGGAGGG